VIETDSYPCFLKGILYLGLVVLVLLAGLMIYSAYFQYVAITHK
jgi:hypothetical protein